MPTNLWARGYIGSVFSGVVLVCGWTLPEDIWGENLAHNDGVRVHGHHRGL